MKKQTWNEMKLQYPDEWLLITDLEQDQYGNTEAGVVIRHSNDEDEIYKEPLPDKPTAMFYTGESTFSGLRSHVEIADPV